MYIISHSFSKFFYYYIIHYENSLILTDNVYQLWINERLTNLKFKPSVTTMLRNLKEKYNIIVLTNGKWYIF